MTPGPDYPELGEEGVGYSEPPTRAAVAQVAAVLAGPVLYLLALAVKYGAVHAACRAGSTTRLHVFAALFFLAVVAVAVVCHRAWRRFEQPGHPDPMMEGAPNRRRVTMLIALMLSVLFALGVVFLWLPVFAFDPCRT